MRTHPLNSAAIDIWTGGSMRAVDAIASLRDDGFPVVDVKTRFARKKPVYEEMPPAPAFMSADEAFATVCREWRDKQTEARMVQAGNAAKRLIAQHVSSTDGRFLWRHDKPVESALFALAQDYTQHCCSEPVRHYVHVIGSTEHLSAAIDNGSSGLDSMASRDIHVPGFVPRAYRSFRHLTMALNPIEDMPFPVIVAHDAYAVAYSLPAERAEEGVITVGIMPRKKRTGVVGCALDDARPAMEARLDAPLTFDPEDIRERMRLRRLLAKQGDNE